MYDELIGNLRAKATHFHFNDETSLLLCKAADAIEDLIVALTASNEVIAKSKQQWIPVTERLPEEEGKYLTVFTINTIPPRPVIEVCCYAKDLYKVDKYDFQDKKRKPGFYQYDSEWGFFEMSDITHWMPLPEPPKEE